MRLTKGGTVNHATAMPNRRVHRCPDVDPHGEKALVWWLLHIIDDEDIHRTNLGF